MEVLTDSKRKQKIGIISGSGPDAGLNVMQKILALSKAEPDYKNDKDAPDITLLQVPGVGGPHGLWDLEDRECQAFKDLWEAITNTIRKLELLEVDCFCLPCNTLHVLEPDIHAFVEKEGMKAKFVSIVGACRDEIKTNEGIVSGDQVDGQTPDVAVLGSMLTTNRELSPYLTNEGMQEEFNLLGLDVPVRERLQELINNVKKCGPGEELTEEFENIIAEVIPGYEKTAALAEDEDDDNVDDHLASSLEVIPEDGEVAWKEEEPAPWSAMVGSGVFDRACFGTEDRDHGDNHEDDMRTPLNNNNLLELESRTARLQKLWQLSEENKDYNFPNGKMEAVGPWAKLLQRDDNFHYHLAEHPQVSNSNPIGGTNFSPNNNGRSYGQGLKKSQSGFSMTLGEETTTAHDHEEESTTSLDDTQTNDGCHTSDGGGAASSGSARIGTLIGTPRGKKPCKVVLTLSCTELPLVINDDITHQLKKAGVVCVDPNLTLARALYQFEVAA